MVIVRRSASVFIAVFFVSSQFWGCRRIVRLLSNPPFESCETASLSPGTWLSAGVVLLVAAVLWFAPWSRFMRHRPRIRPLIPARHMRRLGRIGGWSLMALGVSVILGSTWGVFRDWSRCTLEIGCYDPSGPGPSPFGVREPAFSLVRIVGVAFGLSALAWGSLAAKLHPRHFVRQLLLAGIVFLVLVTLLASGYPGLERLQATAFVIVIVLAVLVILFREVIASCFVPSRRSRYALLAAMALTVILGAYTFVLASVNPIACGGGVPCAAELRSATLVAVAAAAAGLYLVFARWKASAHPPASGIRNDAAYSPID